MSKYGFDPSELIETKIDLIDKDGFHGVGEAGNQSNNSEISQSSSVIFSKTHYDNADYADVGTIIILKKEDYPELFDDDSVVSGYTTANAIYVGENYDLSALEPGDENSYVVFNGQYIGESATNMSDIFFQTDDIILTAGSFAYNFDYSNTDPSAVPLVQPCDFIKGEITHIVLCYNVTNNQTSITREVFVQIDAPWPFEASDFE